MKKWLLLLVVLLAVGCGNSSASDVSSSSSENVTSFCNAIILFAKQPECSGSASTVNTSPPETTLSVCTNLFSDVQCNAGEWAAIAEKTTCLVDNLICPGAPNELITCPGPTPQSEACYASLATQTAAFKKHLANPSS